MPLPRIDPALAYMVEVVNREDRSESTIWLSLTSSSVVLSGQLISGRAFFDQLSRLVGLDPSVGADVVARFGAWGKQTRQALQERLQRRDEAAARLSEGETLSTEELDEFSPNYIHLQHVTVLAGSQGTTLPVWRGRLVEIAGWAPALPT